MGGSPSPIPLAATKTNQMTPACLGCHIIFLLFPIEICAYLPRKTPLWSPHSRTEGRDTNPNEHLCFDTWGQCRTCAMKSGSLSKQSVLLLSDRRWTGVFEPPV